MNLQEQILRIKLIIETINKSSSSLFDEYLATKPELIELYQEIEKFLGDKFTKENFDEEIKYSLGLNARAAVISRFLLKNVNCSAGNGWAKSALLKIIALT